jgi:hypothetical protein
MRIPPPRIRLTYLDCESFCELEAVATAPNLICQRFRGLQAAENEKTREQSNLVPPRSDKKPVWNHRELAEDFAGTGWIQREGPFREFVPGQARCRREQKRGVPRPHEIHAAWELLSPDLRCFC